MRSTNSKLEQVIAKIRLELVYRVRGQLVEFQRLAEDNADGLDFDTLNWLHFECHKINGIAKSVGLDELGSAAVAIEDLVENVKNGTGNLQGELPKIRAALHNLTLEIQSCSANVAPTSVDLPTA